MMVGDLLSQMLTEIVVLGKKIICENPISILGADLDTYFEINSNLRKYYAYSRY